MSTMNLWIYDLQCLMFSVQGTVMPRDTYNNNMPGIMMEKWDASGRIKTIENVLTKAKSILARIIQCPGR
jgi:hypothetical protein